jgi:flagellar FliJ protein
MRRFHFRLEPFLRLREYKEQESKLKMAEVTGSVVDLENRLSALGNERVQSFGVAAGTGSGALDISELESRERYVARLDRQTRELRHELEHEEERREQVRQELNEAMKQRKVLDALKTRRAEEYYAEARRAEAKQLDDLANSKSAYDLVEREDAHV